MRSTLAAAIVPCALLFAACFPDYGVNASSRGDAAVDSGAAVSDSGPDSPGAMDSGGTMDSSSVGDALPADAGSPVLVGSTKGAVEYPAPMTLAIPYQVQHAGDLLVLGTYIANSNVSVTSVADTLGSTFQHVSAQAGGTSASCSSNESNVQIWYGLAAGAGSDTISLVHGGNDAFGTFVLEYAGLARGGMLDDTAATVAAAATTTMTAGTLTTAGPRDVVVALFADFASYGAMTAGSGFAAEQFDTGFSSLIEDDVPAGVAPGMHEAQAELPADNDAGLGCWVGVSAAFE